MAIAARREPALGARVFVDAISIVALLAHESLDDPVAALGELTRVGAPVVVDAVAIVTLIPGAWLSQV